MKDSIVKKHESHNGNNCSELFNIYFIWKSMILRLLAMLKIRELN